jgi:SLT domain-containing protein
LHHQYLRKIKIKLKTIKIIRLKKPHQISICFTSKQYGALTVMLLMHEMLASMLTIGRISGGNLTSLSMKESSALNGKQKILFKHMQMVVEMNIDVNFLMAGKNKNIIHITIRCMPVDKEKFAQSHTALTFTPIKTRECQSIHFSNFSPETEVVHQAGHIMLFTSSTNQFS